MKPNLKNLTALKDLMLQLQGHADRFRMSCFLESPLIEFVGLDGLDGCLECGTVGCAAGWASLCVLPRGIDEDLYTYSGRLALESSENVSDNMAIYNWLFSGEWSVFAPEPDDIVKRINYFIEHGCPITAHPTDHQLKRAWELCVLM